MLILNDLHCGVQRTGGTTPTSREALRSYIFESIASLLKITTETHLVVIGDLFDAFEIDPRDWLETYAIFNSWLSAGKALTLIAGNHDVSSKGTKVSSFTMLAQVLQGRYPGHMQVLDINSAGAVDTGVWAIAHHANQDLFNAALDEALLLPEEYHTLMLHCNLSNYFAQQSDHSLDLSAEYADKFAGRGIEILLAHEHTNRKSGTVTVLGCQFPTSISDCLNNDAKFAHTLNDGVLTKVQTWNHADDAGSGFAAIDWRELAPDDNCGSGFIRVTGTASANEAGDCISAISKFRSKSTAFVITNGVHIEGVAANEDLPESFEAAKAFDVLEFLYSNLDEAQTVAVKKLMESCEGKS